MKNDDGTRSYKHKIQIINLLQIIRNDQSHFDLHISVMRKKEIQVIHAPNEFAFLPPTHTINLNMNFKIKKGQRIIPRR